MATPRKIPPRIEPNAEIGADCCLKQFSLGLELISRSEFKSQEVIIFKKDLGHLSQLVDALWGVHWGGCSLTFSLEKA